MILALVLAAQALTASRTIDVPFVPQTDLLCGGAAAAMVFRYWGDTHANGQQFASLVDRRAGGIASGALVDAVRARGWRTEQFAGSIDELRRRLAAGEPVIVLVADRPHRYHYLVVVGVTGSAVVVHDPSWGPSRAIAHDAFVRVWRATDFWSLAISPVPRRAALATGEPTVGLKVPADASTACDAMLDRAVEEVRQRGLDSADAVLGAIQSQCPASPGPWRELAGVRFAQQRWGEASALARQALDRDAADAYALDVLGSSLFMRNDPVGALRAWNQIGKPQLDIVRIDGLHHARYQAIVEALAVPSGGVLTADAFALAQRRLDELPDRSSGRLTVRPEADGFASLEVVIAERPARPHGVAAWASAGLHAAVDREVDVSVPGFTGQGEVWSGSWRWWNDRPQVAIGFEAPRVAGLFGVWRVEGSWEAETYRTAPSDGLQTRESRTHAGLTVSDWLGGGRMRYAMTAGLDSWSTGQRAASVGASIERRWLADRISATARLTTWIPAADGTGFSAAGARARLRSSRDARGWVYDSAIGMEHVTEGAPMTLWAGAGDGHARVPLLRAHPLLADGVIDVTRAMFGRTMTYGTAEAQRWLERFEPARVGIAAFIDVARASRQVLPGPGVWPADVGAGLRLRVPGSTRTLRFDAAYGLRDGASAIGIGWLF
jgi:predicted double-glycine peptidase